MKVVFQRKKTHLPDDFQRSVKAADHCAHNPSAHINAVWNLSLAARDALCAGMLAIKWDKDLKAGIAYFAQGADLHRKFLDFARRGLPAAAWHAHHLIYCNLLCSRFDAAAELSEWAAGFVTPEPHRSDEDSEAFGRLLGLFVLDHKADFASLRNGYFGPSRPLSAFWQWQTLYLDLYKAVLDRDQARFDALMQARERVYVARSKDKRLGESSPEFGGGEGSQFVFDFMGVGIAKLARHRGMRCDFEAVFLPKMVVDAA